MKVNIEKFALALTLIAALPAVGLADTHPAMETADRNDETSTRARLGDMKERGSFQKMVDESTEVYRTVTRGSHGQVSKIVLDSARCIAVLPGVLTGAIVVGGAHGSGLASCKDAKGAWSQPAAISLSQGSLGLQVGAKSTDLVLFFQTKEAASALKSGNFALGSDVSAVAGDYNAALKTPDAGVVAYSHTEGVFAGASVNGSRIGRDESEITKNYGRSVDFVALLENRETPETTGYSKKLTSLFPS